MLECSSCLFNTKKKDTDFDRTPEERSRRESYDRSAAEVLKALD